MRIFVFIIYKYKEKKCFTPIRSETYISLSSSPFQKCRRRDVSLTDVQHGKRDIISPI